MKIERTRGEIMAEAKLWSEYLFEVIAALKEFQRYTMRAAQHGTSDKDFLAALAQASYVGADSVLDESSLDLDKLRDLLVERAEWIDDRPLIE